METETGRRSSQARAIDDVVALVGHARPHLVDAWDALAVLESSGYTDARVHRELGLADTRELAEHVYAQLSARPLPPAPAGDAAAQAEDTAPRLRTTIVIALAWGAVMLAVAAALRVPAGILRLALVPSLVICCGFVEAMRRRGGFYASIGQPQLARVTSWYFMRIAAIGVGATAAVGAAIAWAAGVPWPALALWADSFLISSTIWLLAGATQVPAMLSRRGTDARIPLPRMTILAVGELRVLLTSALAALVLGALLSAAAGYAAVGIIGGISATFVLSTMISRWSAPAKARPISLS